MITPHRSLPASTQGTTGSPPRVFTKSGRPQPISAYMSQMHTGLPTALGDLGSVSPLPPASVPGGNFVPQILSSPAAISMFSDVSKKGGGGREGREVSAALSLCVIILVIVIMVRLELCLVCGRCSVNTHWINEGMLITSLNVCRTLGTILNSLWQSHKVIMLIFPILNVGKLRQREP